MHHDPIVETRICKVSWREFSITQKDTKFYKKIAPKFGDYIAEIPFPTLCPEERMKRICAFRNQRKLYRRECNASQRQIISMYRPDNWYVIYDQKIRRWDSREWVEYGREFDFTKTFTEQFDKLMKVVPRMNLINDYRLQTNSEYINMSGAAKDCYLIAESDSCENCSYSTIIWNCKNCFDCWFIDQSSTCYECFYANGCSQCKYSSKIENSNNLLFCEEIKWSQYCFMCFWLENQSYCILNKQYSKPEYDDIIKKYLDTYTIDQLKWYYFARKEEHGYMIDSWWIWNENVVWKFNTYSKDSENLTFCSNVRDCKNMLEVRDASDCYDYLSRWENSSQIYQAHNLWRNCYKVFFSEFCRWECNNILYSDLCVLWNTNLFWCVGLRNKSYCIFNKQYTKQEYEALVPRIIEHMKETWERWEYFDPSLSPFAYNETVAQEYYPISKKKAIVQWFKRSDYQSPTPKSWNITPADQLPKTIDEVDDSILQTAIVCEVTWKLYRIQSKELAFYRKYAIPVPRKHPDQRHLERLEMRK